ncbi:MULTISPECIES: hypothetical protein [unclassified Dyella]|jgi:hypothetical protein|uniref:hypothetical protein n=1 Tax=unclassified Dyella TaxID=2634549 RepID=UPI003F91A930
MNITLALWRELYRFENFGLQPGVFQLESEGAKVIAQAPQQALHAMLTKLTPG